MDPGEVQETVLDSCLAVARLTPGRALHSLLTDWHIPGRSKAPGQEVAVSHRGATDLTQVAPRPARTAVRQISDLLPAGWRGPETLIRSGLFDWSLGSETSVPGGSFLFLVGVNLLIKHGFQHVRPTCRF